MSRKTLRLGLIYFAATLLVLYTLLPIIWVLLTSFKAETEIVSFPPHVFPQHVTFDNYSRMFETDYRYYARNSLIVGVVGTALVMVLGIASGYSYSKFFTYKAKNAMMIFIIIARMVPEIAVIIPLYFLMQTYNLYDSKTGLILMLAAMAFPLATWLLKTFFDDVPVSITEAATIDGCSSIGVLVRVILPISWPAIASTVTITFLTIWNSFLIPLVFTKSVESKTLPVAISEIAYGEYGVNWGGLSAIAIITIVPVFVIGLFAQKYLTAGLTAGAEKG
ncbi:MAG TPA: carbohydrate ABC transporter permease [Aggregatilinea sp.]|jgi:ABC-type glycerol-3-phosphate transport system permease component|uniref:carbohydrate ABC transporter permease n=1 Tax=Aggregatilinea sp. TaxID=2806333 RepID=UPI002CC96B45|nr:carbohydrate ABC transporter permease [Aggregatilinea sp.]HML21996.1 carbohydrate ABC transporter permease [Aggregatilinea sp.]